MEKKNKKQHENDELMNWHIAKKRQNLKFRFCFISKSETFLRGKQFSSQIAQNMLFYRI